MTAQENPLQQKLTVLTVDIPTLTQSRNWTGSETIITVTQISAFAYSIKECIPLWPFFLCRAGTVPDFCQIKQIHHFFYNFFVQNSKHGKKRFRSQVTQGLWSSCSYWKAIWLIVWFAAQATLRIRKNGQGRPPFWPRSATPHYDACSFGLIIHQKIPHTIVPPHEISPFTPNQTRWSACWFFWTRQFSPAVSVASHGIQNNFEKSLTYEFVVCYNKWRWLFISQQRCGKLTQVVGRDAPVSFSSADISPIW